MLAILLWAGAGPGTAAAQPAGTTDAATDGEPAPPVGTPDGEPAPPVGTPDGEPALLPVRVTSLDGTYLALGPVASFVRTDGKWDGGFGGEISLVRVREREPLSALGIAAGVLRLAADDRGRVWSELMVGTRLAGIHAGLGAGVGVEIDSVRAPRWGGHATVWIFAGVVPYARVGVVEEGGLFAEIGLKIALPVVDW
jgi:hypothetical protein